jgi:hypothetical protein
MELSKLPPFAAITLMLIVGAACKGPVQSLSPVVSEKARENDVLFTAHSELTGEWHRRGKIEAFDSASPPLWLKSKLAPGEDASSISGHLARLLQGPRVVTVPRMIGKNWQRVGQREDVLMLADGTKAITKEGNVHSLPRARHE